MKRDKEPITAVHTVISTATIKIKIKTEEFYETLGFFGNLDPFLDM